MSPLAPAAGSLTHATGKLHALPASLPAGAVRTRSPGTGILICAYAQQHNIQIDGLPEDPGWGPSEQALHIIHNFAAFQFPLLHPAAPGPGAAT
jgi:hypothetical protein